MIDETKRSTITRSILESYDQVGGINHLDGPNLPSRQAVLQVLDQLLELLFPGYFESIRLDIKTIPDVTEQKVSRVLTELSAEISKSLVGENAQELADQYSCDFLAYVPQLRTLLKEDISAIFEGDPAAKSEDDIILSYPGFYAITVYRIAHYLDTLGVPLIPRIMTEISHNRTGIDIHPHAKIGRYFFIDHGTGIVIGETSVIGDRVKLYQGVTIGALSIGNRHAPEKRHPTLEDGVTVYARTTILGGSTVIGKDSTIGGNVWLTQSVPPNSKLVLSSDLKQVLRRADESS